MQTRLVLALVALGVGLTLVVALATFSSSSPGKRGQTVAEVEPSKALVIETPTITDPTTLPRPSNPTIDPTAALPPMTPVPTMRRGKLVTRVARPTSQPIPTPRPEDPFVQGGFGDGGRPSLQTLSWLANTIVIGNVKQVGQARWSTADGKRPVNPHAADSPYTIFRPVLVEVQQYLKGDEARPQLVLFAAGGKVGNDQVEIFDDANAYNFQEGERVVVFLDPRPETSAQSLGPDPLWTILDHYTVEPDGIVDMGSQTMALPLLIAEVLRLQEP